MESTERRTRLRLATTIPVWFAALVGAVIVGLTTSGDRYLVWLPLVLGLTILLTFCLQLATREKDGLVDRTMLSLTGSLVVLGVATGVLALLGLSA
ncbi:hypothetical protein AS850_02185 [Frondihabitans sp. 762G35]|uniref:hypothetical protein n=1 Tax=Frondihabitans sp. 762G35 TaxID=1446794 RepID=UPI000D2164BE|nr:hypothetical protein [Frondihabitans sp. 762G35]ARC55886.1 hypothetical protein AS850_02185 [Frondihabitans sp. 762G35]